MEQFLLWFYVEDEGLEQKLQIINISALAAITDVLHKSSLVAWKPTIYIYSIYSYLP